MEYSRRAALLGAAGLAATGAVGFAATDPFSRSYKNYILVRNERSLPVPVDLTLRNIDDKRAVLNKSITLASGERFRKEGIMSNNTEYQVLILAGELVANRRLRTCCRGYIAEFAIRPTEIEEWVAHMD